MHFLFRAGIVLTLFAARLPATIAQPPCVDCHEGAPDATRFSGSVHGSMECTTCHAGAEEIPHPHGVRQMACAACHAEVVGEYDQSAHGLARERGVVEAPGCQACHGEIHALVPAASPDSPVHRRRLAQTCGGCHANPGLAEKFQIPLVRPVEAYSESVHVRLGTDGHGGATCNDCHASHAILPAADPRSTVFHARVPETCGNCHGEIAAAYRDSVHGRAAARSVREAPVCTDCHGEHRILSPRERGSPVFATNIPKMTCGRCHGDLRLAEKFGIPAGAVSAYQDSYHGLAARSGIVTVAHCGSCHGIHDILASSDPRSHVHPANLPETCGGCHPGAGSRFAIGTVHVTLAEPRHPVVRWVRRGYLGLIYLTIGGMVLHNLLDLVRKVRIPPPRPSSAPSAELRMSAGFRMAHAMLMVTFSLLVYTGFALRYPESWWAHPLLQWESTLGLRGWLHRTAAVLLLIALGLHVLHLIADRRARRCVAGMRPTLEDLRELRERLLYFVGRRPEPPASGRLGYPEKLEYLALMWGLLIMSATGFMLWFDDLTLRWLPKWVADLATVIHFYEAVLASLAILVWHFYFVIFDPVVYPMDPAWLTGRAAAARQRERRSRG